MDKPQALELLGLDDDADESAIGRAQKKLSHKNRSVRQLSQRCLLKLSAPSCPRASHRIAPCACRMRTRWRRSSRRQSS